MASNFPSSLDTCVILRAFVGNVPSQASAARRLISDPARHFQINDLVFFESVYTLQRSYAWPRRAIATTLAGLIGRKNISCNRNFLYQVLDDYVTHPSLSFADCYLARSAQISDIRSLWTFDRKLANQSPSAELIKG